MIKQSDHNLYCSASSGKWTGLICVCGVCVLYVRVCGVEVSMLGRWERKEAFGNSQASTESKQHIYHCHRKHTNL